MPGPFPGCGKVIYQGKEKTAHGHLAAGFAKLGNPYGIFLKMLH